MSFVSEDDDDFCFMVAIASKEGKGNETGITKNAI
jgi:hypothetical protein